MRPGLLLLFLFLIYGVVSTTEDHPHRVVDLPGAPEDAPQFPLYAGFIDIEMNETQHNIFYVLCEAIRADPLESPLVVWLNGGPGASSLLGFSLEHGPYLLQESHTGPGEKKQPLRYNDLSWNQYANVLYIESPTNVGFSHANRTIEAYDDYQTAKLNMKVLEAFMTRAHSRYYNRDFYITGESYAGAYVPLFAQEIVLGLHSGEFTNDNFRGMAIGNPTISIYLRQFDSSMQVFAMGMLPPRFGERLLPQWNLPYGVEEKQTIKKEILEYYKGWSTNITSLRFRYNLHATCEEGEDIGIYHVENKKNNFECNAKRLAERYFNDELVKKALHVNSSSRWMPTTPAIMSVYDQIFDTVPAYKTIFNGVKDDFRVLFYAGDLDLICPSIHSARGTAEIGNRNGFEEIADSPKVWSYLGDFGGARTSYRKRNSSITLDVLTIRGSGHMVPINHPSRLFQVINNFLFSNKTEIDYSKKIRRKKFARN